MNHTPQIKKAIQFAARKHAGQLRREVEPLPYITHLFSAALLVAEDGEANEAVVIATLLHDVMEDTGTTKEQIARAFGTRVAELVETVSEPNEEDGRPLEWKEKKKRYLAQLELGSDDALLIALADKIDNIESKLEAFDREGAKFFERWSQPPEQYAWFYGAVLRMAQNRLKHHALTKRLTEACTREREVFARF